MPAKVRIPSPFQKIAGNHREVEVSTGSIRTVLDEVEIKFPGFKTKLCYKNGEPRGFVFVGLNDQDVRCLKGSETPVKDGDEVFIFANTACG